MLSVFSILLPQFHCFTTAFYLFGLGFFNLWNQVFLIILKQSIKLIIKKSSLKAASGVK
jgi:hypothetical protein